MSTLNSLEKILMPGKIEGRRRKGCQKIRWLDGITDAMDTNLGKLRETVGAGRPGVLQSTGSQRVGHDWATNNSNNLCAFPFIYTLSLFTFTHWRRK